MIHEVISPKFDVYSCNPSRRGITKNPASRGQHGQHIQGRFKHPTHRIYKIGVRIVLIPVS